jgi:16S rRNA (cytidine1402-2'-O)-methyltransferase
LIKLCREEDITFEILPGANALLPAVVATPTDTSKFVYLGFPPHKKGRQTFIKLILQQTYPVYIYESVHRVEKLFKQLKEFGYDGKILVARELTKMFEQYETGTLDEILLMIEEKKIVIK